MNQGASFIFIALMFAFFYFLIIRPQRRRMSDLQSLQRSLELGDEVVTVGGILGTIQRFDGEIVTIELSPGTEARVNRRAISARIEPEPVEETTEAELDQVAGNHVIQTYIALADQFTGQLGFTEHGFRHANLVGHIAYNILSRLGFEPHQAELAAVAGYLHDVGNVVSRQNHPQTSALIAMPILTELGLPVEDIGLVVGAIGNHEEELGRPVSPVSAAVNIADKSDVHRSRVRKDGQVEFDIHDRVNFAVRHSFVRVDAEQHTVTLELDIDTTVSDILEYFEIFLTRMMMCRRAAEGLECKFRMTVNGSSLL